MKPFFIPAACMLMLQLYGKTTADKSSGRLNPERTSYDVLHYDIRVRIDPETKTISVSNAIRFKMLVAARQTEFDLNSSLHVEDVRCPQIKSGWKRKKNKIRFIVQQGLKKDSVYTVTIQYKGQPDTALLPPWKGGMVWKHSEDGMPWVGLACESIGASVWLACKDLWNDEPDSADIRISLPTGMLTGVSNGKLISVISELDGLTTFHWKVKNPINHYGISLNAGNYSVLRDTFDGHLPLPLTYYVLKGNEDIASRHFKQVHTMLHAFEHFFGPYPFPEDGYKLVETPYWGMEHQSCIAYGNHYINNAYGFDFIIIHESGHEWFANSITASDPADLWIHESFTTYAEALFVEYTMGRLRSLEYLADQKKKIAYTSPMLGKRRQNFHRWKDSDIYYKGTWLLHTLRNSLDNDSLWFAFLRSMNTEFRHKMILTEDVISLYERITGESREAFFRQYLEHKHIPELKIRVKENTNGIIRYVLQLRKCSGKFVLPVHLKLENSSLRLDLSNKNVEVNLPALYDLYSEIEKKYLLRINRRDH